MERMSCHVRGGHPARLDWSQPKRVPQHETAYACARFPLLEACRRTGIVFDFICMRDFGLWWIRHEMLPRGWVVSAFSSPRFPSPPRPPPSSALTRLAWCPASVYFSVTQTVNPIHEASPSAWCSTASFRTELGLRVALLQQLVACAAAFGQTGLSA